MQEEAPQIHSVIDVKDLLMLNMDALKVIHYILQSRMMWPSQTFFCIMELQCKRLKKKKKLVWKYPPPFLRCMYHVQTITT